MNNNVLSRLIKELKKERRAAANHNKQAEHLRDIILDEFQRRGIEQYTTGGDITAKKYHTKREIADKWSVENLYPQVWEEVKRLSEWDNIKITY